jgi:glutaredoxin
LFNGTIYLIDMKKIIIGLIALGALYQYDSSFFEFLLGKNGAFDSDGNPKAILFVSTNCGVYCSDALAHIRKKGIEAEIVNVSDEDGKNVLKRYAKRNGLPVLVVGSQILYGFQGKRFDELLYDAVGKSVLGRREQKVFPHHFNGDGSAKVVMYGTSWCGYCTKARERFKEIGIEHTEWDVEKDGRANNRYKVLQSSGYPLIYVGTRRIGTYDEDKIIESLKESTPWI